MEEKLANGLRDLEVPCRSVGRASTAPSTGCCTTRDGGGTQRGDRQVASSGRRVPEGTCARGGGQSNEESKNIGRELHRSHIVKVDTVHRIHQKSCGH